MQDQFVEISPGYMIPISAIQVIQWKDEKLRIAYDKGNGDIKTIEVEDIRDSARYLYDQLRRLAITYETGPDIDVDEDI